MFHLLTVNVHIRTEINILHIRYDNPGDRENAWANRKEMAAETIRSPEVDIAGLQEALHFDFLELEIFV